MTGEITPGARVLIRDAHGTEHPGTARTRVTPGRRRPEVGVEFDDALVTGTVTWPADAVRAYPAQEEVTVDG